MSWFESKFNHKNATILMIGLDAAGKTTILLKLKLNDVQETTPTVGFNVETVEYRNVKFHLWDIGGQEKLRRLWKHYYNGANAIIFVIDSADVGRLEEVRKELLILVTEPILQDAVILILCNKQDLPAAYNPKKVGLELGLNDFSPNGLGCLLRHRTWYMQGCCAHTGIGVYDGLDWLCNNLPDS